MRWPPLYCLKESARARRVIMRVRSDIGLVITIPKGFDRAQLPEILEARRQRLLEMLKAVQQDPGYTGPANILPADIQLAAIDETWRVAYELQHQLSVEISWSREPQPHITLRGDVSDVPACCRQLKIWLQAQAKLRLPSWVKRLCRQTGLSYSKLSVRCQKTRWGSYSDHGNLTLNAALLFLPKRLARFVILHELCHSRHLRHDAGFWGLLEHHEPAARDLEEQIHHKSNSFPDWYKVSFL